MIISDSPTRTELIKEHKGGKKHNLKEKEKNQEIFKHKNKKSLSGRYDLLLGKLSNHQDDGSEL